MSKKMRLRYPVAVWRNKQQGKFYAFPLGAIDPAGDAIYPPNDLSDGTWSFVGVWPGYLPVEDVRPDQGHRVDCKLLGARVYTASWALEEAGKKEYDPSKPILDLLNDKSYEFWRDADVADASHGPWSDLLEDAREAIVDGSDATVVMKAVGQSASFKALAMQPWSAGSLVRIGEMVLLILDRLPAGEPRRAAITIFKSWADPKKREDRESKVLGRAIREANSRAAQQFLSQKGDGE